ncbi:MAG: hypothetical protein AB1Z19_04735, partial [Eubacteriales bacterium]
MQDKPKKTKVATSTERQLLNPKLTIIIIAVVGVVLIGLAIATVLVATRNAKATETTLMESIPTADPYFFLDQPTATPSPSASPSAILPETGWIQTGQFGSAVNMRLTPSVDSQSRILIRDREPVAILAITDIQDDDHQWYKVTYKEETGYIRDDFVIFEEPNP